ncbi:MAG TPA: biopolymer transporter ExbD [Candidatus Margulisiibacteriota bacterium]|nr:biopolymer transporter ExbD [Candidatus Margulisiibacteriota bacterium]
MAGRALQKDSGDEILSEINVIPLVDISLVLLIIFMVTANYIVTSSFTVDIAQASNAKVTQQSDVVTISISREGPVYLENELVTTSELKKRMQSKYGNNPDISVMLSVDKNVNFKNVVYILDCLSELGITRLNIATVKE